MILVLLLSLDFTTYSDSITDTRRMIGPRNELVIYFRKYNPHVQCDDHSLKAPPSEAACQKILSTTPASKRMRPFHGKQSPHVEGEVVLPTVYTGEFSSSDFRCFCAKPMQDAKKPALDREDPTSCYVLVDMFPSVFATNANWLRIWEAGVAVNALCIRRGLSGTASNLGKSSKSLWKCGENHIGSL